MRFDNFPITTVPNIHFDSNIYDLKKNNLTQTDAIFGCT